MVLTVPHKYLKDVEINGLKQTIITWACLKDNEWDYTLLHLSAVGQHARLKALWSYIMDGGARKIKLPNEYGHWGEQTAQRLSGSGNYRTFWNDKELPESGMAHLDITHKTMFGTKPHEDTFALHLCADTADTPDYNLFFRQLDGMITIPLRKEWKEQLWQFGIEKGVVKKLTSFGCTAYSIEKDERKWATIVVALTLGTDLKHLNVRSVGLERYGSASTLIEDYNNDDHVEEEEEE